MRRFAIILGLTLIALAVLTGLGIGHYADELLRPWVVTKAATALAGEVRLDRLELGWDRLDLYGVEVARRGEFRLKVEQVTVHYSLFRLWQRRLKSVAIRQPELEWDLTGVDEGEAAPWPQQPPFRVGTWNVEGGRLLLALGKDRLLLRQLEATGNLDSRYTVAVTARLGNEPGEALALSGHGTWEGPPELTLNKLSWANRSLLQAPVTVTPGGKSFEVDLALAQLDDTEAARLLAAVDREPPWPPELAWKVTAPRLTLGIDGERLALRVETAAGEVRHQGERWPWENLRLQLAKADSVWQIDGEVALAAQARVHLAGSWSDERLRGRWQLTAPSPAQLGALFGLDLPTQAAELQELMLTGDLQAAAESVVSERIELAARWRSGTAITGILAGRWQGGTVSVTASDLAIGQGDNRVATAALTLSGRPTEGSWRGRWQLQVADAQQLAATLAVAVPTDWPNLRALELQGEVISAGDTLVLPVISMSSRIMGTGLSGKVAGRLAVRRLVAGWRCEVAQLAATALEYTSPDGLAGLTGGALQLTGTLSWQGDLTFALQGEATAAEALAGSWYADLGGLPLRLAAEGSWRRGEDRVRLHAGHLDLAGLVTARLQGSLSESALELSGEAMVPKLDGAFQTQLRQLAVGVLPALEQLTLAGGLTASGAGRWRPDGWELTATVRPAAVTLAWGESVRLAGLSGELPLLLQRGSAPANAEHLASLQWDELRAGPINSRDAGVRLSAGSNRWRLVEPLRLTAGGGLLELSSFALDLPATGPEMRASLSAKDVAMAEISRAYGWPQMGGSLGAKLPDIRFTGAEIRTDGEALLEIFDGTVRIRNLLITEPFSRYPTYHADIEFSGIDLQPMTQAFDFGEMNGVADGSVRGLRLFGLVPSAFRANLETREQGSRNISVKALRNLNTLSQGGLSAVLSQGIYRFIDFYRYRKIGIRCSLQNDVLRLEGTAKPGSTTYLVDGGWLPPRIDIIVSSPTISFQEMVKRLKRIERAGH